MEITMYNGHEYEVLEENLGTRILRSPVSCNPVEYNSLTDEQKEMTKWHYLRFDSGELTKEASTHEDLF